MYTLQNSKGETVQVAPNFRTADRKLISEDQFEQLMQQKYNCKRFRGMELANANGDIDATTLAYQYATDRLTYIRQKYVDQTFYEIPPADYMDVVVGEGAFAAQIITNLTIATAGGFNAGKLNTSGHNARLNVADAGVIPIYTRIRNWALANEYSVFDVNQSAFSGNWDIVEAKHRSRKKAWDLGIQGICFLGDADDTTYFPGLFSQSGVNSDTTTITKKISSMSYSEFDSFVQAILASFLSNCNQTAWPNTFVIPQDDYAGLAGAVSSQYPTVTKLEWLQNMFNAIVPGGKVKIVPAAYGMAAYNKTVVATIGTGKARYVLYKKDIDTLFMEIPVDYQTTQVGTLNNFNFQDVAYGQYAGVTVLKPLEVLYFDY